MTRASIGRLGPCAIVLAIAAACGPSQSQTSKASPTPAAPVAPQPRATEAAIGAALDPQLAPIVDGYRKVIVLLESETALDADTRQRAVLVGRLIYQENHQLLSSLTEALTTELAGAAPLEKTTKFLDALEANPELHDADKLAFFDVVNEIADTLHATRAPSSSKMLTGRVDSDVQALKEIQSLYNKELDRIFGRFDTRGMPVRREAWDAYITFLRTRYAPAAILKEYNEAVRSVLGVRGAARANESLLEISGTKLPAKTIVLTFDDGPHPKYTDRIREILKKHNVPAVFFEVGRNLGTFDATNQLRPTKAAAASQRLLDAGFQLANHSYTHELLPKLSDREIASEIEQTDRTLRGVMKTSSVLFRPPYGARNEKVLAAVQARGLKAVLWNIDSRDWADPIPQSIANRVVQLAEGEHRGIVLFHDIQARTIDALPQVIETLQSRGYQFATWNGSDFSTGDVPTMVVQAPETAPVPTLYRESWAVVIGIDDYAQWPKLSYAGNDARAMRDLLVEKYSFKPENITMLLNKDATRERILSAIGDALADPTKVNREDRVFIFFAGHGATRRLPNGRALGYIVPVDADIANYQSQAISMSNFQDISEALPAKHVFFMTDACYSGIAAARGGAQNYLQEVTRRTARQILTAGGADEEVADNGPNGHSIFTWTVMQGLEGRADLNNDGFITASELAAYVGPIVSSLSHQTPAFASLPGSEGGEFVFELKHESEFLGAQSKQLDEEGIRLNGELDRIRAALAAKRERNEKLRQQIASERARLDAPTPTAPAPLLKTAAQHNDRGVALFREKRYVDAQKEFLEAIRLNPTSALAANNVGYTFDRLEKYDDAIKWFDKTLQLDPQRAIAHANMGDAYLALGRTADARREFEKYLELQPLAKYSTTVRDKLQKLPGAE